MKVRTEMNDDGHHKVAFSVSFFQKNLPKALQTLLNPPQSQEHCRIQFTEELWSFSMMEYSNFRKYAHPSFLP